MDEQVNVTRGQELAKELDEMYESLKKDILKVFDKGQNAAARRGRKTMSQLSKWCKATRQEVSAVKRARKEAVKE